METQTPDSLRAVYLTAEDLRLAASILYNAYHYDAFFQQTLPAANAVEYEQKLRAAIREELNELWQQEQPLIGLFDAERLIGVACVVTSSLPQGEGRYWHWRLKMLLGTGWQSTQKLMQKENSILEHLPATEYGIIQFIAVALTEQRKGYGKLLVQAVLGWCDEQPELEGVGVFVTEDGHSHLFREQGFVPVVELNIGQLTGELLFYHSHTDDDVYQ
ncbi:GNAT family N-acetyltransferase [Shewanella algae]|nr:GNAT family N-acetyltransferase [Shewanella algae]MBC8795707.1 GNAT family N-acetyltransferase [Shewanella algae]MBO2561902.1 GNAT family N-acetyltransferase [Shewanella algae]MBO2617043.1 GNAT family N-acetyltransferase [Shewanella algae]MBO2621188.1 GNAT family N-acetyltransferase [Shewanella algae]MBO2692990.1 GNAT family N-acetyltransferase [Shewanella algae]